MQTEHFLMKWNEYLHLSRDKNVDRVVSTETNFVGFKIFYLSEEDSCSPDYNQAFLLKIGMPNFLHTRLLDQNAERS